MVVTIAVLFEPLSSAPSLRENDLTDILKRPIGIGQTPDGMIIVSSNRDQAEIVLALNKIDVRDLSGDIAIAKTRIPQRLSAFLQLISPSSLTSFGLNFVTEIPVADAQKVVADSFLDPDLIGRAESEVRSDSVSLSFRHASEKEWTLRFGTRGNEAVTVNFNASEAAVSLPEDDELGRQLETQYEQLVEYVKLLRLNFDDESNRAQ